MNLTHSIQLRAMACQVLVQLQTVHDGKAILSHLPDKLEAYENSLSRFRPNSELMQFNAQAGQWVKLSDNLFEAIQNAKQAARRTEGWFNPLVLPAMLANGYDRSFELMEQPVAVSTPLPAADWQSIELDASQNRVRIPVSTALDLGGIAKAWVAAKLADELAVYGACSVNIGGDIALRGSPYGELGWQITIADPIYGGILQSLNLTNTSIVTSGIDFRRWQNSNGESYHHIVNPFTGQSVQSDVLTATVVHPHAPTAEAYTKVLFCLGAEKGLNWLHQQWQGAALIVKHDGSILASSHFAQFVSERTNS
jgi:thiamine biosynthesis lipoprotein